jgi:HEAT repeat protein/predicted Ser/Thr protein kinase
MSVMDVTLGCARCGKSYRVKAYAPDRKYSCPACRVELDAADPTVRPAQDSQPTVRAGEEAGAELRFRDEHPVPKEIPVRLGKYVIEGEIARGGMGVVYTGRQEGLDRVVAIKMLLGGMAGNPEAVKRFHREARAAAKLRHPHIVAIHEVGEHEGQPFFTMDFIQGRGLDALLRDAPVTLQRGAGLLRDVARAVHYAHEQGIIHRDLKPANVLVDGDGAPHVTDFGLAKDLGSRSMLSVTGEIMGTPAFMSPEQAEGDHAQIDRQTDVYSLGAILYRILTGKPPFEGPTMAATLYKIVNEYTQDPCRVNRACPPELSAVCMKALDKDKRIRYKTAAEFAEDLDRFLKGEPVSARPLSPAELLKRKIRRQKKVFLAAGMVAAVALVVIAAILLFVGKSELDVIEAGLAKPEMRLAMLKSLLDRLDQPAERSRAIALAKKAVREGTDEESRKIAYARPHAALGEAYHAHLAIEKPEALRVKVIQILGEIKYREAVDDMILLMRRARGPVRVEAVRFFSNVPDARAFYDLGALVSDREVGAVARQAIKRQYIDNVLVAFDSLIPGRKNPSGGTGVQSELADMGLAIAEYNRQVESILGENQPRGARPPRDGVELAILALRSTLKQTRMQAVWELGQSKDVRAREPLFQALGDAEPGVARMAAESLASAGAAEYKDKLLEQLKDGRAITRRNAAYLLGKIGDTSARAAVDEAYKAETDAEAKDAMLDALTQLR